MAIITMLKLKLTVLAHLKLFVYNKFENTELQSASRYQ